MMGDICTFFVVTVTIIYFICMVEEIAKNNKIKDDETRSEFIDKINFNNEMCHCDIDNEGCGCRILDCREELIKNFCTREL